MLKINPVSELGYLHAIDDTKSNIFSFRVF